MITYILFVLIILNFSLVFSINTKEKLIKSIIPSIGVLIVPTFIFGIFNILYASYYFIIVVSIVSFVYNVYFIIKRKVDIKKYFSFELFVLLIVSFVAFIGYKDRLFWGWDEFSHWGLSTKNMFYLDSFFTNHLSTTSFSSYLPGINLLQYFILKLNTNFVEGLLYFSNFFIIISIFLDIISSLKKHNLFEKTIAFFILMFIPTLFYNSAYTNLQVDFIMGLLFFYVIYNCFYIEESKTKKYSLYTALFLLTIIKDTGILFTFGFGVLVLSDNFIKSPKKEKVFNKKNLHSLIFLLPWLLWKIHLKIMSISSVWPSRYGVFEVISGIFGSNVTYHKSVVSNFIRTIFKTKIGDLFPLLSSFSYLLLFVFLILYIYSFQKRKKEKTKTLSVLGTTFIGCIIYFVLLLIMYLFLFSQCEAVNLASFERYVSTYLVSLLLLLTVVFFKTLKINKSKYSLYLIGALFLIFTFTSVGPTFSFTGKTFIKVSDTIDRRDEYHEFIEQVKKVNSSSDKIYFISENTDGESYFVTKYLATPNKISPGNWSIATIYNEDDIWSNVLSLEEWEVILLNEYDYVYLEEVSQEFIDKYNMLFIDEVEENTLYKINKDNNRVLLIKNI